MVTIAQISERTEYAEAIGKRRIGEKPFITLINTCNQALFWA